MLSFLTRYFKPEIRINAFSELREGLAIVQGIALAPEELLVTPFRGRRCLAYGYRAFRVTRGRQGPMPSLIRDVHAYTRFPLQLEGGTVFAVPKKVEAMTQEEHRELQSSGIDGFYAEEDAIEVGRRVELEGMVVRSRDGFEIRFKTLADLGAAEAAGTSAPRRGRRRRKKP